MSKISLKQLIDQVNSRPELTKREKLEKVIDLAYSRIYQREDLLEKVECLVEITEGINSKAKDEVIKKLAQLI